MLRIPQKRLHWLRLSAKRYPIIPGDSIQPMRAQRMPFGNHRMVKVIRGFMPHAQRLHQPQRRLVDRRSAGHHLRKLQPLEAARHRCLCRFAREALPPMFMGEPPTDFHRWAERQLQTAPGQPGHTDESSIAFELQRPEPEAEPREMDPAARHRRRAFVARQQFGEIAHHQRVAAQLGQCIEIAITPGTQTQARCFQFNTFHRLVRAFP